MTTTTVILEPANSMLTEMAPFSMTVSTRTRLCRLLIRSSKMVWCYNLYDPIFVDPIKRLNWIKLNGFQKAVIQISQFIFLIYKKIEIILFYLQPSKAFNLSKCNTHYNSAQFPLRDISIVRLIINHCVTCDHVYLVREHSKSSPKNAIYADNSKFFR